MKRAKCPICAADVPAEGDRRPEAFPFCSARCRDADLYRWFEEEYAVPVETNRVAAKAIEELERQGVEPPSNIEQN